MRDERLAGHAWHFGVGDEGADPVDLPTGGFEAGGAVFTGDDDVAGGFEDAGKKETNGVVILDDKDGRRSVASGAVCGCGSQGMLLQRGARTEKAELNEMPGAPAFPQTMHDCTTEMNQM